MGTVLQRRLRTEWTFLPGEEVMLALGLAAADLGSIPEEVFSRYELSHTQYNVLRMLRGAGATGLLHGEITERLIMGVPDVTRLMDRLERRDLIRRDRLHEDRRKVVHRITDSGRKLLDQIDPELQSFYDWICDTLPNKKRESLIAMCEDVIEMTRISQRRVDEA